MKISTKGKYALRVLVDIAVADETLVSLSGVSERQNISIKYLEQIAALLKDAGLLESVRGASGGYRLAKDAKDITVAEILCATGDSPKFAACVGSSCPKSGTCKTGGVWQTLANLINDYLGGLSLADLINQTYNK